MHSSVFPLVALTTLAAAVRLPQLQADSLWVDEAFTSSHVHHSFPDMISATISDNYPPLYNAVTWCFVQAFGDGEWVLRLPAALFLIALVLTGVSALRSGQPDARPATSRLC